MSNEQKAASVEFDEKAARNEYHEQLESEEFEFQSTAETRAIYLARWQFDKDAAAYEHAKKVIEGLHKMVLDNEVEIERLKAENERLIERNVELKSLLDSHQLDEKEVMSRGLHECRIRAKSEECTKLVEQVTELVTKATEKEQECARLKKENEKYRSEMDKITNGIPSEWAYSILKKERDELQRSVAALEEFIKSVPCDYHQEITGEHVFFQHLDECRKCRTLAQNEVGNGTLTKSKT